MICTRRAIAFPAPEVQCRALTRTAPGHGEGVSLPPPEAAGLHGAVPSPRGQHRETPSRTPSRRHSPAEVRTRRLHRTSRSFTRGSCSFCMDRNLHFLRSKLYFRSDSPTTSCGAPYTVSACIRSEGSPALLAPFPHLHEGSLRRSEDPQPGRAPPTPR